MAYAFVRNLRTNGGANIKHFAQITSAQAHAKREDLKGKARSVRGTPVSENYFWSKCGFGLSEGGADYAKAFKAHKSQNEITTERKGAALGLHLLVGISPEWLAETGSPHSLDNPRVQELIKAAKDWAESWMGEGAVWAVRYDTDEQGSGIVDILASPIRSGSAGKGKPKPQISVNKALKELQASHGEANSYAAMQTSWAKFAQAYLDAQLLRGKPDKERKHLTPEEYGARQDELKRVQEEQALAERRLAPLRDAVEALEAHERALAQIDEDRALREAQEEATAILMRPDAFEETATAIFIAADPVEGITGHNLREVLHEWEFTSSPHDVRAMQREFVEKPDEFSELMSEINSDSELWYGQRFIRDRLRSIALALKRGIDIASMSMRDPGQLLIKQVFDGLVSSIRDRNIKAAKAKHKLPEEAQPLLELPAETQVKVRKGVNAVKSSSLSPS